eukprot:gnl/TRDRNA2_/TRDRNA2_162485_c0_seq3.p1 gnl/TRDRNA2_/TRDRNA2_162485_c0~~gnl/TRDRNA2_/TRDRNA2_162485_c0_seq3.p1  ORF type:complete len:115 (+),score=26.54 gnl/TRDRNA2_/TRDRNA2_162485_c0_seq3:42-386(+)
MVNFLVGHLKKETDVMPWRISVFFNGMHIRDSRYHVLFDKKAKQPTVLVFGQKDEYYKYAKEGWCGDKPIANYYENPLVLEHGEGHQFPSQQPHANEIYQQICAEIWKQCEGVP